MYSKIEWVTNKWEQFRFWFWFRFRFRFWIPTFPHAWESLGTRSPWVDFILPWVAFILLWVNFILPWVHFVLPWVHFVLPWVSCLLPWVNCILPWVNFVLPWVNFILPWLFILPWQLWATVASIYVLICWLNYSMLMYLHFVNTCHPSKWCYHLLVLKSEYI